MGRAESEIYISANGYISFAGEHAAVLRTHRDALPQRCINASAGPQTGESGQASNPETTTIPSAGSKPDDAIFAYWTGKT